MSILTLKITSITNHLIKKYLLDSADIIVIEGGETRNDILLNSIRYIEDNFGIDDDSIIVTHGSGRPFVTHRIIEDNIEVVKRYGYEIL